MSTADTKQRLEAAVLTTLQQDGLAGLSGRKVAGRAGVNQALIFFHYDSVNALIDAAARNSVRAAIERHRAQLMTATSFAELLAAGRDMHSQEREHGNVAVMAQLVAGAHLNEAINACARACLDQWIAALEPTVRRLLADTPVSGLLDPGGLTRTIASAFIGLELYDAVDPAGAADAMTSLQQLGAILEAVEALGSVATRAIRSHVRRRTRTSRSTP